MTKIFNKQVLMEITNLVAELPYGQVREHIEYLEQVLTSKDAEGSENVEIVLTQDLVSVVDAALVKSPYKQAKPLYDYINRLLSETPSKEPDEEIQAEQELVE